MKKPQIIDVPFVNSVLHPTDLSPASQNAFAHALAISLLRKTNFTILHVSESNDEWTTFPAVRNTLEQWSLLEKGSSRSDVYEKLAIKVEKVDICCSSKPENEILDYIKLHPTDLIVLATEGRNDLPRWLHPSIAERIATKSKMMTLFVHGTENGFVSLKDGELSLHRILIPIDFHPSSIAAIKYAARAARLMIDPVEIILFHVGDSTETPTVEIPEVPSCSWKTVYRSGKIVEEITKAANEYAINLIVMSTAGHEGFLDAFRGSVTEQVLRQVSCPVLAIPADID
jgi:nucleotide-binding universal stress UspA family protein